MMQKRKKPPPQAVENKFGYIKTLNLHKEAIKSFGVRRLGLFGSFVRDEQRTDSDIDILVEFEPGLKKFDNFMGLAFFLETIFHRTVELVTPESLSPYFKPNILKEVEYVSFAT
jgi:hypothetical protein